MTRLREKAVASLAAVSSVATPPDRGARSSLATGLDRARIGIDVKVGLGVALALTSLTFVTVGGVDLAPNTWTEIVLVGLGAAAAIAVVLIGAPGRAWGAATVGLFGCLVVLTAASVTWSVQPDTSWVEAGRTLSYMAAFGGAAACARLFPDRWPALLGGIAITAVVVSGYALLVKVFPATLDPNETFGRLRAPFDYWNATGLTGAVGLPLCLWSGARPQARRLVRALCVPCVAVLIGVIVLSYSRGAVLAGVVGLAVWFTLVPLRLRGALILLLGGAGGAVISAYALRTHALTANSVPLAARTASGHSFGVVIAVTLAVLLAAGFVAALAAERTTFNDTTRRRIGTALVVAAALLPVAGIGALAASSRGLTGEVSHVWHTLTGSGSSVANGPNRLVQLGNSRGRYWREGITVGRHALVKGVGALGYGTAVTHYTYDPRTVGHAHSYVIETFADFGLIGVALMLAMLASWSLAARRTLAGRGGTAPERAGLQTMLVVVVIFGVHSTIDWTWFVPGAAVPALVCAGWLAGRGPIAARVGTRPRRSITRAPGAAAVTLAVTALALACGWEVWQPLRASDATSAALSAASSGHLASAIADAKSAANEYPVGVDPLFDLAAFYDAAGLRPAAHAELIRAVDRQPQNAQTWLELADFDLRVGNPREAMAAARMAKRLDHSSYPALLDLHRAHAQLVR